MNETNAVLAERFRQNDPTAFAKLFGRYHSLVFNRCLRMLHHRQDAEDATQETFSRMARYLDRWDPRKPLEPWLIAIAGNRCRVQLSRRQKTESLSTTIEPTTERCSEQLSAQWLGEEVQLAVSRLPEKQRTAFILFHEELLNYAQIAVILDAPVGTVKTWVHRARMNLIDRLRQREVVHQGDTARRSGGTLGKQKRDRNHSEVSA
ncbi:MAG: sigma-70 family RNA polymerase sigma factor [Pirellulaceae bacterium]|nr:sigma-70 family RNA polymerase sigma factor [Pirellulaceae bacterium]